MVRVLLETSLPLHTVEKVRAALEREELGKRVSASLRVIDAAAGCQRPASGGGRSWTPCWIIVESSAGEASDLGSALVRVKELVTEACREGGLEVFCLPATAQIGDEYRRFRDILDISGPGCHG